MKKSKLLVISLMALTLCGCKEKTYKPIEICYQECIYNQEYENEKDISYSYKEITFEKVEGYKRQWAYEITLYLDDRADFWICWLGTNTSMGIRRYDFLYESELKYPNTDIDCDFYYSIKTEVYYGK